MSHSLAELDMTLLKWFNSMNLGMLGKLLVFLTDLHKSPLFVAALLLCLVAYAFKRKAYTAVFFLVLWIALGDFVGGRIKDFAARERPDVQGVEVSLRCRHAGGGSFPSNHTLNNFAFWSVLFFAGVGWWHYLVLLLAILIAWSRIYCGVHFPSDVLGGMLLGIGWGYLGFVLWTRSYLHSNRGERAPGRKQKDPGVNN